MRSSPLVVIVGPTASGKSALAMRVAREFNGEIICADSRTVYKGMDIGTAKPSTADRRLIKHHLLDVVTPDQSFTVADFKRLANRAIGDISGRGKLPILVGGSGLYIDAVIFDYNLGAPVDLQIRHTLDYMSIEELQLLCRQNNIQMPENRLNKRYLIRAIEQGGVKNQTKVLRDETIVVGISTDKESLRDRILKRAEEMVDRGILEEVKKLSKDYGWESEAMKGNIYRAFKGVIEGVKGLDEALAESVQSDLKLAKKQATWFKRNKNILWGNPNELFSLIEQFVAKNYRNLST